MLASEPFQPRELDFVRFLAELLSAHPRYCDVLTEPRIDRHLRPDLAANRQLDRGTQRLVIEVKSASFVRANRIEATVAQIDSYRTAGSFDVAALAFPGRFPERARTKFQAAQIEIWDLDYIAKTFSHQVRHLPSSPLTRLYSQTELARPRSETDALIQRLHNCPPGEADWLDFQRIVKNALETLFVPPLGRPIWESADRSGANRRDIILPNYAFDGFWKYMRETYKADYIVVDAKNCKGAITKAHALQIANYLKPDGAGMFGIIAARNGANASCKQTVREQWTAYRKMIILLTDDDIEDMLRTKGSNGSPEELLGSVIQDFRLSI